MSFCFIDYFLSGFGLILSCGEIVFSFVTFEKEESVDMVMKLEHEIMGKYVETKRAEPRDSNRLDNFTSLSTYLFEKLIMTFMVSTMHRPTFDAYGNSVGGFGSNNNYNGPGPQMGGHYGGGGGGYGGRGGGRGGPGGRYPHQGGRGGMQDNYGGG